MYEERFFEPHALGVEKFNNGDNAGRYFCNERTEQAIDDETGEERTVYVYDVYEVSDCRDPHKIKNEVIATEHPDGDEEKLLRKTLAKLLKAQGLYDNAEYSEFKSYNEFVESINV